jgi:hypothetical protein
MSRWLIIPVLIACGGLPVSALGDNLIVPGRGIGSVKLGMTAAELYRVKGEPKSMMNYGGGGTRYDYPDLSACVSDGSVIWISTDNPQFSTQEGLHPGESQLAMQAKLGPPAGRRVYNPFNTTYWYTRGGYLQIEVNTTTGIILVIRVDVPGHH